VREIFQAAVNDLGAAADVTTLTHMHERLAKVSFAPES
jgi:hypothetical protein